MARNGRAGGIKPDGGVQDQAGRTMGEQSGSYGAAIEDDAMSR